MCGCSQPFREQSRPGIRYAELAGNHAFDSGGLNARSASRATGHYRGTRAWPPTGGLPGTPAGPGPTPTHPSTWRLSLPLVQVLPAGPAQRLLRLTFQPSATPLFGFQGTLRVDRSAPDGGPDNIIVSGDLYERLPVIHPLPVPVRSPAPRPRAAPARASARPGRPRPARRTRRR